VQDETEHKTKYVVGLGNPGSRYAGTRHNVGFRVVEALAGRWQADPPREAFDGKVYDARATRGDETCRVRMLTPQTYMNCSGRAVKQWLGFYKAGPDDVLIVLDDMALPPGALRMRAEGSAGGHNGLSDVLRVMGGSDVARLRLGIGSPPPVMDAADYVLQTFSPDEDVLIGETIDIAAAAVEDWVFRGVTYVMNAYNRKGQEQ